MINLTLEKSEIELISGIPEYVIFSVDIPSSVFYTLDGSIPDENAFIASGRVYLPSSSKSFILTAIAISEDDASDILVEKFFTNVNITKTYNTGYEGIQILPYGSEPLTSLSYDENGELAQGTSLKLEDLDIVASRTDYTGIPIKDYELGITTKDFINLSKDKATYTVPYKSTPNNNNVFFDPKAKFIEIDGSTDDLLSNQIVKIVNRPYGNMDPVSKGYNESMKQSDNVITGNLVKSFYNPSTGIYVSYYYESKDSRWIVSKQKTVSKVLTINFNMEKNRFVFRWIEDRHMTKLF